MSGTTTWHEYSGSPISSFQFCHSSGFWVYFVNVKSGFQPWIRFSNGEERCLTHVAAHRHTLLLSNCGYNELEHHVWDSSHRRSSHQLRQTKISHQVKLKRRLRSWLKCTINKDPFLINRLTLFQYLGNTICIWILPSPAPISPFIIHTHIWPNVNYFHF